MTHRRAIRDQVKASLMGKLVAGDRVFTSRATPINAKTMPCVLIYIPEESRAKADEDSELRILRSVKVIVEGALIGTSRETVEDEADEFLSEIETIMRLNPTLDETAERVRWRGSIIDMAPNGEALIAACRVEYDIEVWTDIAAPGAGLDLPQGSSFVRPTTVNLESQVDRPDILPCASRPIDFGGQKPPYGGGLEQSYIGGPTPTDNFGEELP